MTSDGEFSEQVALKRPQEETQSDEGVLEKGLFGRTPGSEISISPRVCQDIIRNVIRRPRPSSNPLLLQAPSD